MSENLTLPVLPLDDEVVLPTMVVPIDTSDTEVRAAIEAAKSSGEHDGSERRSAPAAAGAADRRQVRAGRHPWRR